MVPDPNPNPNSNRHPSLAFTQPLARIPTPNPNPKLHQVRRASPVCIALRVAAAFSAGDAVGFWRGVRALPPLAACCTLHLLPALRASVIRQVSSPSPQPQP